ncbi:MAG: hypothetical protein HYR88_09220 [Verrucomicrobia bacterium]|nr:hypothetical protein [Verrucomicrobiota bacterium]
MFETELPNELRGFVSAAYGNGRFVFLNRDYGLALCSGNPDLPDLTLRTDGEGRIVASPDSSHIRYDAPVTLTAIPGRWHRFDRWGDWVATATRTDLVSTVNDFTAIFAPTTRLETIVVGGVTRKAPVGMPAIVSDGRMITSPTLASQREVRLSVQSSLSNAVLSWTFDGSLPKLLSHPQARDILLRHSGRLRVVAYSDDGTPPIEADPLDIGIEPAFLIAANTAGGGAVSADPAAKLYPSNTTVSVSATPFPGWSFVGWQGDVVSSVTPLTLTMSRDVRLEAVFASTVPRSSAAGGLVLFDPDLALYPFGSTIWMTALPSSAYAFGGWSGLASNAADRVSWTAGSSDPRPIAQFVRLKTGEQSLVVRVSGGGAVAQSPAGGAFKKGQSVTLEATPMPGQAFISWTGDAAGTDPRLGVLLDRNKSVTAQFTRRPTIKAVAWPPEGVAQRVDLVIEGYSGAAYAIEVNSGAGWSPLVTVTNGPQPTVVKVPITADAKLSFFRALEAR